MSKEKGQSHQKSLATRQSTQPDAALAGDLVNRGARLLREGKAIEAIPLLQQAVEIDADNVSAALNLGGAYVMAGKHRLAVPILEEALKKEPLNPMVWINLGAACLDRPPYMTPEGEERAIQAFERALELDPAAPSVSYNLGLICKDRGELEKALDHFQHAVQTHPGDRDAHYWIRLLQTEIEKRRQGDDLTDPTGKEDHPVV